MYRTIILLNIILICYLDNLYAQKEANIWYFGFNAGLDFNAGLPVPLTDGKIWTKEGCASIADSNGRLLFYTDGITIWNKNHQIMPNGTGLKGHESSTQSAIIVPKPNSKTKYYIFTVGAMEDSLLVGVNYSEVDMTLLSGMGNVTSVKNIHLFSPTCEKITAVKHINGRDIWVITHEWGTDIFDAYLVTPTGINSTPVKSHSGYIFTGDKLHARGYMKVSPDGQYLGFAFVTHPIDSIEPAHLFKFNNNTGIVSDHQVISNNYKLYGAYGLEFSPNSNLLYVAEVNSTGSNIYQYDLSSSNIPSTQTSIGTINGDESGALQLGPDGRIYSTRANSFYLGVINKPDIPGLGCNYVENQLYLNNKLTYVGLPSFIQSFFKSNFTYKYTCLHDSTQFNCTLSSNSFDSLRWNFGDLNSGIKNISTLINPVHIFSDTGTFIVKLITYKNAYSDTTIKKVTLYKTQISLGNDTTICGNSPLLLNASFPNATYLWQDSTTSSTINVNQTGQYWVKATANGCIGRDTIHIAFHSISTSIITAQICQGRQYTLPSGKKETTSGIYKDTLINHYGCDSIITVNLSVLTPSITNKSVSICSGNFYLLPNGLKAYTSGIYSDTLTGANTCDSIIITDISVSLPTTIQKAAHICLGDYYILPNGNSVNTSGIYDDTIKTQNNCDSVIITHLFVHFNDTLNQIVEICAGESYTLPSGIHVNTAGNYTSILKTMYHCDSIIKTQLSVVSAKSATVDTLACDVNSYKLPSGKLVTQNGTYVDSIKSKAGCDSIITTHLQLDKKPQIQLADELTLCLDSTLLLQPIITNSQSFHWQDNSILPTYTVTQEGTYILSARNVCGETQHTTIVTTEDCSACELYVPTAFSPNNDGVNDILLPLGNCNYKNLSFKIFNRWGELVFETNTTQNGWNGFYKNTEQPVDTYAWILNYMDSKNTPYTIKGIIQLVR